MPPTKPKIPEYPRPVSPICGEEIPICKNTTVYHDANELGEPDENQRAAKRRRIESYAAAYLRGESLFISTAQLKGPFDGGWRNPWKRVTKVTNVKDSTARSVEDETTRRPIMRRTQSSGAVLKKHASPQQTNTNATAPPRRLERIRSEPKRRIESVLPPLEEDVAGGYISICELPRPQRNCKVEDWLKRNDSYIQPEYAQTSFSSPLAKKSPRTKTWEPPPVEGGLPPMLDAIVHVARSLHSIRQSMNHGSSQGDGLSVNQPQSVSLEVANGEDMTTKSTRRSSSPARAQQKSIQERVKITPQAESSNRLRTESPALEAKQSSTADDGVSMSSPSSYNRNFGRPQEAGPSLLHGNDVSQPEGSRTIEEPSSRAVTIIEEPAASGRLPTASQKSLPVQIGSLPTLSTHQLITAGTNQPPSAQVPSQPTLRTGQSNLSSNGDMLEISTLQQLPGISQVHLGENAIAPAIVEPETNCSRADLAKPNTLNGSHDAGAGVETPRKGAHGGLKLHTSRTSEVGTARRVNLDRERNSPTKPASHFRATRSKKKASFTNCDRSPGSSQGSIKSAMRVAKRTSLDQTTVNLKSALSHSFPCEVQDDIGQTIPRDFTSNSKTENMIPAPKGILKSSVSASLGRPLSSIQATSSGSKQDAQRRGKLDAVVGSGTRLLDEEGFDLDAAIDDLGSYLDIWDAEKEAAQLSNTSGQSCLANETGA